VRELRAIVFQGRETGAPVVVQPAETQGQINSLTDRLNDLDHTLTQMNGQMEVVRHDLDQIRQENTDLRARDAALKEEVTALEQRVQGLTAPPPPPPPVAGTAPAAPAPDEPATAFLAARALWQSGDKAGAEAAFRDYTDRFGDSPRGPEARYYLGKALLARNAWPEAATADIGAIRGWPQTRWAPDAVLDLTRALVAMGKTADACQTLAELGRRYPKPGAAVLSGARSLRAQAACK
jgi:TolA-binding protein